MAATFTCHLLSEQRMVFVILTFIYLFALSIAHTTGYSIEDPFQNHVLHRLLPSSNPGVTIPVIKSTEFHNVDWSREPHILENSHGFIVYHNYTLANDKFGRSQARWTKREFTRIHPHHTWLQRRGFSVNPYPEIMKTWSFIGRHVDCPIVILMCYANPDSKNRLADEVQKGIQVWHDALGDNKGVIFRIIPSVICGSDLSDQWFSKSTVQIKYSPGDEAASAGFTPEHQNPQWGRHYMLFDPDIEGVVSTGESMVHELGHILGLLHEHQRFDAANYVKFNCENLKGYAETVAKLEANPVYFPDNSGRRITIQDLCTYPELANEHQFPAASWMPQKPGTNLVGVFNSDQTHGEFDKESIMLYPSLAGAVAPDKPVITWLDGTFITANNKPSAGDIATVKAMYPDILT